MRVLLAALTLTTAAFAVTTVHVWRDRDEQRARADSLEARVTALEAAPAAPLKSAQGHTEADSGASPAVTSPANRAVAATPPAITVKVPPIPDTGEDWQAYERRILAIPEYREARMTQRRRELARLRDEGIRIVGVTPEQADKLVEDMIERELAWSGRPNPRNAEEAQQRQLDIEESKRNQDAALRGLLGEAKATQWNEYMASQPSRSEVRRLSDSLAEGSEPLRDDQIEPLVSALHAERTQLMKEMEDYRASLTGDEAERQTANLRYTQRYTERMAAANERTRKEAASILSQQQLTKFDAMRARQLEIQKARQHLREVQSGANVPSVTKGN